MAARYDNSGKVLPEKKSAALGKTRSQSPKIQGLKEIVSLVLNINRFGIQLENLLGSHQSMGRFKGVIDVKKLNSRELHRHASYKASVTGDFFGWKSKAIHVDNNLHLWSRFDVLVIGDHISGKTMNHQDFWRKSIFLYQLRKVLNRKVDLCRIHGSDLGSRDTAVFHGPFGI